MGEACHSWDPAAYTCNAHFVSDLGHDVVELLHPLAGQRILDLGCGDGTLALALTQAGASVLGVDSSPEFIAAALARGVDARVMDAEHLAFTAEFDAVFSNAALHWMRDADAVIAGVRCALMPGGRFVGECRGDSNGVDRGAQEKRNRRCGALALVFPHGGRISRKIGGARVRGRDDSDHSAANAVADRYAGLVGDVRRSIPGRRRRIGACGDS